jgi:myo-inositol-1(or 4)-monophosphatase
VGNRELPRAGDTTKTMSQPITKQIIQDLTLCIREAVLPYVGSRRARAIAGTAASGDVTFHIDEIAEEAIVQFIESRKLSVAYYSEDKGLMEFGNAPESVLIIDPIDGTRPAMAGFEACVVSVAMADYTARPTLADVNLGCIMEIKSGDVFMAERGKGVEWRGADGARKEPVLLPITEMRLAPLTFEAVARPFELLGTVLGEIVDTAALRGGCYLLSSSAFSLTRLATGQLAACLDVATRIVRDCPWTRERFVELGAGQLIGLFTYDVAAAALIASEAGAIVTDAYGRSFLDAPLLDTSEGNHLSMLAASTPELHEQLLRAIDAGIGRLRPE